MTLSKETKLGTISVSNILFAQIIGESFTGEYCLDRVWPSTKRGRQIGNDAKFSLSEFANHIDVQSSEDEKNIDLEFSIIVKFGTSIRKISEHLADDIAKAIEKKSGKKPHQIKIRIAGVKSKQIAKRNLEVIKQYGNGVCENSGCENDECNG